MRQVAAACAWALGLAAALAVSPGLAQDRQPRTAAQLQQLDNAITAQRQAELQLQQMRLQREQEQQRQQMEIRLQLQQMQQRAEQDRRQLELDRMRR